MRNRRSIVLASSGLVEHPSDTRLGAAPSDKAGARQGAGPNDEHPVPISSGAAFRPLDTLGAHVFPKVPSTSPGESMSRMRSVYLASLGRPAVIRHPMGVGAVLHFGRPHAAAHRCGALGTTAAVRGPYRICGGRRRHGAERHDRSNQKCMDFLHCPVPLAMPPRLPEDGEQGWLYSLFIFKHEISRRRRAKRLRKRTAEFNVRIFVW